jgi:hypothetical protein
MSEDANVCSMSAIRSQERSCSVVISSPTPSSKHGHCLRHLTLDIQLSLASIHVWLHSAMDSLAAEAGLCANS